MKHSLLILYFSILLLCLGSCKAEAGLPTLPENASNTPATSEVPLTQPPEPIETSEVPVTTATPPIIDPELGRLIETHSQEPYGTYDLYYRVSDAMLTLKHGDEQLELVHFTLEPGMEVKSSWLLLTEGSFGDHSLNASGHTHLDIAYSSSFATYGPYDFVQAVDLNDDGSFAASNDIHVLQETVDGCTPKEAIQNMLQFRELDPSEESKCFTSPEEGEVLVQISANESWSSVDVIAEENWKTYDLIGDTGVWYGAGNAYWYVEYELKMGENDWPYPMTYVYVELYYQDGAYHYIRDENGDVLVTIYERSP